MQQSLDREGFLNRRVTRPVTLSDGAVVNIRALPASMIVLGAGDEGKAAEIFSPANLLTQSLCDESGIPLFAEGESDQVMCVDREALMTLLDAIMDLNGLKRAGEGIDGAAEKN